MHLFSSGADQTGLLKGPNWCGDLMSGVPIISDFHSKTAEEGLLCSHLRA